MRHSYRWPVAALLLLVACESPSGPYGGTTPSRVDVVSGDLVPNTVVGTELSVPLVVRVVNGEGRPLRGQIVNFTVTSGGGSVFAGTAQTDQNGEARERWKLGTIAGDTQRVEARAVDNKTGAAQVFAVFRAVGTPDAPAALTPVGAQRTGTVGSALADSLAVKVADKYGNAVPNATVTWSVKRGGGSVSPAQSRSDAAGIARSQWVLGTRADSSHVAGVALNATVQAEFTASASIVGAVTASPVSGGGQRATVLTSPAEPLRVVVRTADGRPVAGAPVRWTGAGLESAVVDTVTNANGEATARVTLGREARAYLVTAQVGTSAAAEFTLFGTPAAPASLTPWYSGTLGGAVSSLLDDSIGVVVRDAHGNVVPGASVVWSAASGGGSFAPAASVADSAGLAWTRWTLGAAPGQQRARATVQGTSTAAEIAANAGTELRILAGDNILSFDGTLWEQPRVALFGPSGPIGEARVEWTVASGGGSVSPAASRTSLSNNSGSAGTTWTLGGTAGAHQLTARVGNLRATLTAQRPAARPLQPARTPGGRVLDAEPDRALVLDSAGGTYTLRVRALSGGGDTQVATGGADLNGRLFDGGVIYTSGGTVYDWRGGASVPAGPGGGIVREGGWAAWASSGTVYRRNLATLATDSLRQGRPLSVLDVSTTGQVLYFYSEVGPRYVAWGTAGSALVASGTARARVAGDTAWVALDPSTVSQYTFYKHDLVVGASVPFFRGRDGQRVQFTALGGRIALREGGSYGLELTRLTFPNGVERIGRRPFDADVFLRTEEAQALSSSGSAAFLVHEGAATWLVLASRVTGVTSATQVPSDSRLLERSGSILLATTSSVYVVE